METTSLFIVDDQSIILDGLTALFEHDIEFEVVGRASNGAQAVEMAKELKPQVVLMDISMPEMDGIDATKALFKCCKEDTKVLVLSMYNNKEFVHELMSAGASGYILKNTGKVELREALRTVAGGLRYLGKAVQDTLDKDDQYHVRGGEDGYHALTKREKQIGKLVCTGMSTQQVAEKLFISPQTVETHRKNMLHKLDIRKTAGLVKYAMEHGWEV